VSWGWPEHKGDNLTADRLENVGASTSDNPMGLHSLADNLTAICEPIV
jgi:hypothetical protein